MVNSEKPFQNSKTYLKTYIIRLLIKKSKYHLKNLSPNTDNFNLNRKELISYLFYILSYRQHFSDDTKGGDVLRLYWNYLNLHFNFIKNKKIKEWILMKKLMYLMVVIAILGLFVSGCIAPLESVFPTSEKGNP